jgi:hypothetical protein
VKILLHVLCKRFLIFLFGARDGTQGLAHAALPVFLIKELDEL